jgi:putative phosphoribosyl transferase
MSHLNEDSGYIQIPVDDYFLFGNFVIPQGAKGLILFVHGSGSSRLSPRNQHVAQILNEAGFATLLFDLLTEKEEQIDALTAQYHFDIGLLTQKLIHVTDWVSQNPQMKKLSIGYFGASTGAAAALLAAGNRPESIKAIVSRGGRPDLADPGLEKVHAPTLLIVGGNDYPVIDMNEYAYQRLTCPKKLVIVPGATHLFEEPGKLEEVAHLSSEWFKEHLN